MNHLVHKNVSAVKLRHRGKFDRRSKASAIVSFYENGSRNVWDLNRRRILSQNRFGAFAPKSGLAKREGGEGGGRGEGEGGREKGGGEGGGKKLPDPTNSSRASRAALRPPPPPQSADDSNNR